MCVFWTRGLCFPKAIACVLDSWVVLLRLLRCGLGRRVGQRNWSEKKDFAQIFVMRKFLDSQNKKVRKFFEATSRKEIAIPIIEPSLNHH